MKTHSIVKTFTVLGATALGLATFQSSASAAFLGNYSGFSEAGGCPACDSMMNFAVWQNTSEDWTADSFFSGLTINTLTGSPIDVDKTAAYVYMYQIVNINGPQDNPVPDFSVTSTGFNSFGYFQGAVFQDIASNTVNGTDNSLGDPDPAAPFPSAAVDTPNDGAPSKANLVPKGIVQSNAVDPTIVAYVPNILVDNGVVSLGPEPGYGWAFPNIAPSKTSSVFFATSNLAPTYVWAKTEAFAKGAAGDVPAPASIPTPALLPGLIGMGVAALRKCQGENEEAEA